jgi:hypothetical protein
MKLATVFCAVNNNAEYYRFIPKQIIFWRKFGIRFIAVFVGQSLPAELIPYSHSIILWHHNAELDSAFVALNLRLYYPALLNVADNEAVMITDMDMLPIRSNYYTAGLENYSKGDFIHYRNVNSGQMHICYNAAHPHTWGAIFGIKSDADVERAVYQNYAAAYSGLPGSFKEEEILYQKVANYPRLHILERPIKRLDVWTYTQHLQKGTMNFIDEYDDANFDRSYNRNQFLIADAEGRGSFH